MMSQLTAMAEFLSGQEGEEARRIRFELADSQSDAARFLASAERLSGNMFNSKIYRKLGLPHPEPRVPNVSPPQPSSSASRRLLRGLPWLITAFSSGALCWVVLTCPCLREKLGWQAATPDPPAPTQSLRGDGVVGGPTTPRAQQRPQEGTGTHGGVVNGSPTPRAQQRQPEGKHADRTVVGVRPATGDQVAEKKRLLEQLTELRKKPQAAEAKWHKEVDQLHAQIEQMRQNQAKTIETAVANQTAELQGNLNKAREELRKARQELERASRAEQTDKENRGQEVARLMAQNEQIGRDRDEARNKLRALKAETTDLSAEFRVQRKTNEGLQQDLVRERTRVKRLKQHLGKIETTFSRSFATCRT
jgi:hypothetical protein